MPGVYQWKGIRKHFYVAAIAFIVLAATPVLAANSATYSLTGSHTVAQKSLIARALNTALARMQDDRLRRILYAKRSLYYLSGLVVHNSNMIDTVVNRKNLLWNQLFWLSQPNSRDDTEPPFPNIQITMTYAEGGAWVGRANLDLVKVFWNSNVREWQQTGKFSIQLNSAYIGRTDLNPVYGSADYWAGTIVHEMLHNLGHTHGTYGVDKNYESYQINVFDKIIANNGYENSELPRPSFAARPVPECDVQ